MYRAKKIIAIQLNSVENDAVVIGGCYATGVGSDSVETYRIKDEIENSYLVKLKTVLQTMSEFFNLDDLLFLLIRCDEGMLEQLQAA